MRAEWTRGSWRIGRWLVLASILLTACTDEPNDDKGPGDAAADAGEDPDLLPRRDGGVSEGDPLPPCERFDPTACSAGRECDVVIRRERDATDVFIYSACIDTGDERIADEPCEPWGAYQKPLMVEGFEGEAYNDPCAPGLFCAPDPKIRGLFSCQPACDTGISGQPPRGCEDDGVYCDGPTAFQEVCVPGDDCDPRDPAACGAGQGCYLRFNHSETAALSVCLPELPPADPAQPQQPFALADGEACQYINQCKAGSSCWGPAQVPLASWSSETLVCRRSCDLPEDGADDAGIEDDDAGTPAAPDEDGCEGTLSCADLGDVISYDEISAAFGQCE
jgi:hypothetical protein